MKTLQVAAAILVSVFLATGKGKAREKATEVPSKISEEDSTQFLRSLASYFLFVRVSKYGFQAALVITVIITPLLVYHMTSKENSRNVPVLIKLADGFVGIFFVMCALVAVADSFSNSEARTWGHLGHITIKTLIVFVWAVCYLGPKEKLCTPYITAIFVGLEITMLAMAWSFMGGGLLDIVYNGAKTPLGADEAVKASHRLSGTVLAFSLFNLVAILYVHALMFRGGKRKDESKKSWGDELKEYWKFGFAMLTLITVATGVLCMLFLKPQFSSGTLSIHDELEAAIGHPIVVNVPFPLHV